MAGRNPFEDFDEILETMTGQLEGASGPRVDVADVRDEFVVVADLPGYEADEIDVQLADARTLHIAAERETDLEEADEYLTRERRRRSASRTVSLPEPVDEDGTQASYDNGVLTVRLPKQTPSEGTAIPVEE